MLVVERAFSQQVNHAFMHFPAGKVIEDPVLEGVLLLSRAPVQEVVLKADLLQCPHCRKLFTVKQAVAQEPGHDPDV